APNQKENGSHDIWHRVFGRMLGPNWQSFAKDQCQRDITGGRDNSAENTEPKIERKRRQNDKEEIREHGCAAQSDIGGHDIREPRQENGRKTRLDGDVQVTNQRWQLSILPKISIEQLTHAPLVENDGCDDEQSGRQRLRRGNKKIDHAHDGQKRDANQRLKAGALSFTHQNLST